MKRRLIIGFVTPGDRVALLIVLLGGRKSVFVIQQAFDQVSW